MLPFNTLSTLALCLVSLTSSALASPVEERTRGHLDHRPYCPPRPATPEFQRTAFKEFVHEFFDQGLVNKSLDTFTSPEYIQHNPYILSGRNYTIAALSPGGLFDFSTANFTIMHTLFESPYGVVHYKFELPGEAPAAITDIWRFEGSCIVEHWDVIQSLPTDAPNPIALF